MKKRAWGVRAGPAAGTFRQVAFRDGLHPPDDPPPEVLLVNRRNPAARMAATSPRRWSGVMSFGSVAMSMLSSRSSTYNSLP